MKTLKKIPISTAIALVSFGIGTLLFLSYMITSNRELVLIGFFYTYLAVILNSFVLLYLIYQLFAKTNKEDTVIRILILISNIPIAYFYFIIVENKFYTLQPF